MSSIKLSTFNKRLCLEAEASGLKIVGSGRNGQYRTYEFNECGHKQEITILCARKKRFKCRTCNEDKIKKEAVLAGLAVVGAAESSLYRVYRLPCGHNQEVATGGVRKGNKIRCKECSKAKTKEEAESWGLKVVADGRSSSYMEYEFSDCGHKQEIQIQKVRSGIFKCRQCHEDAFAAEAERAGAKIVGVGGKSYHRRYKLSCGHIRDIEPSRVRGMSFKCSKCLGTSRSRPSYVYLIKLKSGNFEWLKLGHTRDLKVRIGQYGLPVGTKVVTLMSKLFNTGDKANRVESKLHKSHLVRKINPEIMKVYHTRNGFSECYSVDACAEIMEDLREIHG